MRTSITKVRYALTCILYIATATSLIAQIKYVPAKYGGYRTPIYGYQEKDSTYRIIHSSQTAPHTSPFGGIFEINQNGEQTEELLTGGTRVWGACYDNKRGKLIISDNGNGGLWQSDAITHVVDWEKTGVSITEISILPDGRIVGYRSPNGDIWVFDTLGNKIKEIPQPTDCRFSGKFLPYGQNQFVNIGYRPNPSDTLNGQYAVMFLFDSNLDIIKKIDLTEVKKVYDFLVTLEENILLTTHGIQNIDSNSTLWTNSICLLDSNGKLNWADTITYWQNDNAKLAELSNGTFLYIGQGYGSKWLMFTKLSKEGKVLSRDSIGYNKIAALGKFPKPEFTSYCFPVSIEKTLDNGYYLVWKNKVPTFQAEDNYGCWAMKFDSLGNFWWPWSTGVKNIHATDFHIYPNPVQTNLTIELNEPGLYQLSITTANGQVVYEASVEDKETINTEAWSKGVYFYTLQRGNNVMHGKVLKF